MAVSLQIAYNGGQTIDENAIGQPVAISNGAAALAALVELTATANALALSISQEGDQHAIQVDMTSPTASGYAGLNIDSDDPGQLMVRMQTALGAVETYLHGVGLIFASGAGAGVVPVVRIETGGTAPLDTSSALQLNTGRAASGAQCGYVSIGFDAVPSVDGGVLFEAGTGRAKLRKHNLQDELTPLLQGTLGLHSMSGEEELELSALDGDVHYRDTQSDGSEDQGPQLAKGFRAFRANAFGLVGRGYQLPFDNDSIGGEILTVTHNLDTTAPLVVLHDGDGNLIPPAIDTWQGLVLDANTYQITLVVDYLPLVGTWHATLMGF